jgi:hypothetical protein
MIGMVGNNTMLQLRIIRLDYYLHVQTTTEELPNLPVTSQIVE